MPVVLSDPQPKEPTVLNPPKQRTVKKLSTKECYAVLNTRLECIPGGSTVATLNQLVQPLTSDDLGVLERRQKICDDMCGEGRLAINLAISRRNRPVPLPTVSDAVAAFCAIDDGITLSQVKFQNQPAMVDKEQDAFVHSCVAGAHDSIPTNRRILLLASAGTGKTTSIVTAVKAVMQSAAQRPHKLLCMCYNVAAAEMLAKRLQAHAVHISRNSKFARSTDGVFVMTAHKVAYQLEGDAMLGGSTQLSYDGMLRRNTQAMRSMANPPTCVFVDEAQDIVGPMVSFVEGMIGCATHISVLVGDPRQALSGGSGWFDAQFDLPSTKQHQLITNYRSTPQIVAMLNVFTRTHFPRWHTKDIKAARPEQSADAPCVLLMHHEYHTSTMNTEKEIERFMPEDIYVVAPVSVAKYGMGKFSYGLQNRISQLPRLPPVNVCDGAEENVKTVEHAYNVATAKLLKGTERSTVVVVGTTHKYYTSVMTEDSLIKHLYVCISRARNRLVVVNPFQLSTDHPLRCVAPMFTGSDSSLTIRVQRDDDVDVDEPVVMTVTEAIKKMMPAQIQTRVTSEALLPDARIDLHVGETLRMFGGVVAETMIALSLPCAVLKTSCWYLWILGGRNVVNVNKFCADTKATGFRVINNQHTLVLKVGQSCVMPTMDKCDDGGKAQMDEILNNHSAILADKLLDNMHMLNSMLLQIAAFNMTIIIGEWYVAGKNITVTPPEWGSAAKCATAVAHLLGCQKRIDIQWQARHSLVVKAPTRPPQLARRNNPEFLVVGGSDFSTVIDGVTNVVEVKWTKQHTVEHEIQACLYEHAANYKVPELGPASRSDTARCGTAHVLNVCKGNAVGVVFDTPTTILHLILRANVCAKLGNDCNLRSNKDNVKGVNIDTFCKPDVTSPFGKVMIALDVETNMMDSWCGKPQRLIEVGAVLWQAGTGDLLGVFDRRCEGLQVSHDGSLSSKIGIELSDSNATYNGDDLVRQFWGWVDSIVPDRSSLIGVHWGGSDFQAVKAADDFKRIDVSRVFRTFVGNKGLHVHKTDSLGCALRQIHDIKKVPVDQHVAFDDALITMMITRAVCTNV
jgi:hypothetical protein